MYDRFERGNENHSASGLAAGAFSLLSSANSNVTFDEKKQRPLQLAKLSRQAMATNAGLNGAIAYRAKIARTTSESPAAQLLARSSPTPNSPGIMLPGGAGTSVAQPKQPGRNMQSQTIQKGVQGQVVVQTAERSPSYKEAASTARAALRPADAEAARSTTAVKALAPIHARRRAAVDQLFNTLQPALSSLPATARTAGMPAHAVSAQGSAVQLRRAAPRVAAPLEAAKPFAGTQSAARTLSPGGQAFAAPADSVAAQLHRAASRIAAPAGAEPAPAAVLRQRSAPQATAPDAQARPAPTAELRLRRPQQSGSQAQPLAAPNAELELRRTPKAAAPAQPQQTQPAAQEPPRLSTEQLQQAVREMPELDPERLADTVYTALMRRLKFEQRLSGY
ncbi:hypothetical protein [Cohnella hashimotonis]|uniref:Uncharacterized protein n=1 Tax=Cohnella hashimotonis TaxID=2826895 RepID=A0ABT6TFS9_9BACL|nr:hypothetical protein [Cohnella hashimotonis]MDI4645671.1 hypothetical protein [Cohnella hashimotonis]